MAIEFKVNGMPASVEAEPDMPLLWVLRDLLDLKGTKYGCGKAQCGACTVHVDGLAMRSCSVPAEFVAGKSVTTLEGLTRGSDKEEDWHPVLQAWMAENVPQCGYCQPGFMMAAAHFLAENPNPTADDIKANITNICRCGTQPRIIKAILRAAELQKTISNSKQTVKNGQ